jgi:hypothetical protein
MGTAAGCVYVPIGSPIGQEHNGQIAARKGRNLLKEYHLGAAAQNNNSKLL